MTLRTRHPLLYALTVSTVLHTLIVLLPHLPQRTPLQRRSLARSITFTFTQLVPAPRPAPPPKPARQHVQPLAPPVPEKKIIPSRIPKPALPQPNPDPRSEPAAPPAPEPFPAVPETAPAQPAAKPAEAPDSRAQAAQKRAIDEFLTAILHRIEQAKHYPRAARRRGIQGTVTCRFVLARDGTVQTSAVQNASRHAVLERAALNAIARGQPYPDFPAEIQGETFSATVDIRFALNPGA